MNIKIDLYLVITIAILAIFRQVEEFLILYIFIVSHELIHIVTALVLKIKIIEISFLPFGVNAKFNFNNQRIKEILVAMAGPLFSLGMAFIFQKFMYQNIFIFITNMLPIYPLDGGRILKNTIILIFGVKRGIKIYGNILKVVIINLIIINILIIVFLKNYNFIFVSLYILQLSGEEIKKDKLRAQISSLLNMEI